MEPSTAEASQFLLALDRALAREFQFLEGEDVSRKRVALEPIVVGLTGEPFAEIRAGSAVTIR